jgi:hypothetical protein
VRRDATFCGQCYADFRPAPAPAPVTAAPTAAYGTPAPDPLTAPLLDVVLPAQVPVQPTGPAPAPAPKKDAGWPCTRCGVVNALTDTSCSVCSSPFLAAVSEETRVSLVLPVVGDISRYSRGQRAGIAFGAILVLLVPLALLTLLLTGSPAPAGKSTGTTPVTDTTPGFVPAPTAAPSN